MSTRFGFAFETGISGYRRANHVQNLVDRNNSQPTRYKVLKMKIPKLTAKIKVRRRRKIKSALRIN